MTNNTIPNVPRELLERAVRIPTKASVEENHAAIVDRGRAQSELRALLSAPSPAGVDGLEVVGWYRMDDRKAITPYPSVCATWHKMGVKVGAAYSDSAHVIIDGLRVEVEVMTQHANNYSRMFEECAEERDQQARRIGELEGLLRHAQKQVLTGSWLHMRIDAALSAVCAAAPNIATTSEHKVPVGITHISRSLGRAIVRFKTSEQLNDFYRAAKASITSP